MNYHNPIIQAWFVAALREIERGYRELRGEENVIPPYDGSLKKKRYWKRVKEV
jgi:hypothetical protein